MIICSAIKGKKVNQVPLWLMRQAGRYLPEYRAIRKNFPSFIDMCLNIEAATEITLQPLARFDLDGAIVFSDILLIVHALGGDVEFIEGKGPIISNIAKLNSNNDRFYQSFDNVGKIIEQVKLNLPQDKALIGFAGSPWTVASYIVEGGSSKDFSNVKAKAFVGQLDELIELLTKVTIEYLAMQIERGANVIKLFDSWAGIIPHSLFEKFILKPNKKIISTLHERYPKIPVISFPKGIGMMYQQYAMLSQTDCIALDSTISIEWAAKNLQKNLAIQGNLDNSLLLAENHYIIKREIEKILNSVDSTSRFIFNLGHGVLKSSSINNIDYMIDTIRNYEYRD